MQFIGWMYDIAREQSPSEADLERLLARSRAAGYGAVGLYLEHRFAYPSAPWAAAPGCLTPAVARRLCARFGAEGLRVIPFINTLGHMEGFIRAEGGQWLAEGGVRRAMEQSCATRPECAAFAHRLVDDIIDTFDDEWVHIGGDEAWQLGQCPGCAERVERIGRGGLYGQYYHDLCEHVLSRGRRPCIWSDMVLEHPDALALIPREAVIFDWQYFDRPRDSTRRLLDAGFDVVCCPSIQTYNSGWCFLDASQRNIDEHVADACELGTLGVLVTTWELCYFTQYATILPLILAAGRRIAHGEDWDAAIAAEGGSDYARAADILGNRLPAASAFLAPGGWRRLRDLLVIRRRPFALWQAWREEACGEVGDEVVRCCAMAKELLPRKHPLYFAVLLYRVAVDWVRCLEHARAAYEGGEVRGCASSLELGASSLRELRPLLTAASEAGGSAVDAQRLEAILREIDAAIQRVKAVRPGEGYRPAFETLVDRHYVVGDQAAWSTILGARDP
jgi:hypothetical protein